MRKLMFAGCFLALAGGVVLTAQAQAPRPEQGQRAEYGDRMGPGRQEGRPGMQGMRGRMRSMSLVYPAADRMLAGPEVQKIAEAFLLFNGNRTWKVADVTEEPDRVLFAYAAPDGTVIARFAMDRRTGRPTRLG